MKNKKLTNVRSVALKLTERSSRDRCRCGRIIIEKISENFPIKLAKIDTLDDCSTLTNIL